jgi:hypothetical protein
MWLELERLSPDASQRLDRSYARSGFVLIHPDLAIQGL